MQVLPNILETNIAYHQSNIYAMQVTAEKVFVELYLKDQFYSNKQFTLFSEVELPEYKKWSDWL